MQTLLSGGLRLQHLYLQSKNTIKQVTAWFNFITFFIQDKDGQNMTCANNCRGVDPNSVIIGGGAVLAASAVGGLGFSGLAPFLGLGTVAAVGAVGALTSNQCPATRPCRVKFL